MTTRNMAEAIGWAQEHAKRHKIPMLVVQNVLDGQYEAISARTDRGVQWDMAHDYVAFIYPNGKADLSMRQVKLTEVSPIY